MIHVTRGAPRRAHRATRTRRSRLHLPIVAAALLLLAVLASGFGAAASRAGASGATTSETSTPGGPQRPDTGKLTPTLAQLVPSSRRALTVQPRATNVPDNTPGGLHRTTDGAVVVDLRVADTGPSTQGAVRGAGGAILAVSQPDLRTITAAVQPADLPAVAALPAVQSVQEVLTPQAGTACAAAPNSFTSEGDAALHADTARSTYNVDGTGVRVGILSDSYNISQNGLATNAATDVANGDLPGAGNPCNRTTPVVVTADNAAVNPGVSPGDEGRAMAQTVHDLAPGATLDFATAFVSETSFANNITQLATNGADVIVDDVAYFDEPFYQDGPVAVAINNARAAGVAYFSMAYNNNIVQGGQNVGSYETPTYRGATCPTGVPAGYLDCHDYDPTGGVDTGQGITVANNGNLPLDLQWAQPWNGVTTDYDLFVLSSTGTVLAQSTNNNGVTQKPFEFINWKNTTGSAQNVRVVVARASGAGVRFKDIVLGNVGSGLSGFEYTTSSGGDTVGPAIFGHNGAANAFTIAAVPFNNTSVAESYSSRGPVTTLFQPVPSTTALGSPQTLNKPDFAAIDCVQNSFFGGGNPHRFCGTSDAAPHAAAVAALLLDAKSSLTPAQIGQVLADTAVPVGTEPAAAVGAGLINADVAVGTVLGATSTTVASSANPSVVGQSVTYTATVSPRSGPAISVGTVNFTDTGTSIAGCAARPVVSGTATCTTSYAHPGTHPIVSAYTDGATFLPSTSPTLNQVVNKAPTTTALTSAPNPSSFGQAVTFTAHVAVPPPGAGNPTGTVTFFIGANPVFTAPLNSGTGNATFITSAIGPPGAPLHATYNGDADFLASTSNTVNQVVVCDHTITGNVATVVAGSGSTCVINAHVTGSVTTTGAGSLAVINSTVSGSIVDNTGSALRVCSSTIGNSITAQNAVGLVVVGDPTIGCAPNTVGGSMTFINDHAGVMVIGNTYHTALTTVGLSGPGPLPDDTAPVISGNTRV